MSKTLRERLIGAWKLVSHIEEPVDGSEPMHPMGERPQGIIMYTPDGYMSAQLMHPDRPPFASGDWSRGTTEEITEEATGYIAYSGPFHTTEAKQTLSHSIFVSLFPNWEDQTQPRVVEVEGDTLKLSTEKPVRSGGKETMSYLTRKRAEPNP